MLRVHTWRENATEGLRARTEEGDQIMDGLMGITERRTVPQVFIKSEFIGGCDGEPVQPS